jgi:hypothetical protein
MSNAVKKVFSVSKQAYLKEEARLKKLRERKAKVGSAITELLKAKLVASSREYGSGKYFWKRL